jgi:hypothetical protein
MTPEQAITKADDDQKWPEGNDAVFVDSTGKEWLYSDKWELLYDNNSSREKSDKATKQQAHLDRQAANKNLTPVVRERFRIEADRFRQEQRSKKRNLAAAAEYKECPMCDGSGNKGGNPCDCCNGEGQLKAAADRIKLEGGKYILYGTTGMRLAEHITRAAAEAHRDALDARLAVS